MLGDYVGRKPEKNAAIRWRYKASTFTWPRYHGGSALEAGAVIMPLDQIQKLGSLQAR